jgi:hypothetical protein
MRSAGAPPLADVVFSGTYTNGIDLSNPTSQSPATIAAGAYVTNIGTANSGDAVYGTNAAAWALINNGTVIATGTSGVGVEFQDGGTVANFGLIFSDGAAVRIEGAAGTVVNYGTIRGESNVGIVLVDGGSVANHGLIVSTGIHSGVNLAAGGSIDNAGIIESAALNGVSIGSTSVAGAGAVVNSGTIEGGNVGAYLGVGGAVYNDGLIAGTGPGVRLAAGGSIDNVGIIQGAAANGVFISTGTILNSGTIESTGLNGSSGDGIAIATSTSGAPGTVLNYGVISSTTMSGIYLAAGGTVTNAGTIIGNDGTAVLFAGGSNLLVVDPGALFVGAVIGAGADTIELAAGSAAGTLSGLGTSFTGFDAITVDAGAKWRLSGDASLIGFTNDGVIVIEHRDDLVLGPVGEDAGAHGVIDLASHGIAEFDGAVATGQKFVFKDATGTVLLDDPKAFRATIAGFRAGDVIDITGEKADGVVCANGKLQVTEHGKTVADLRLAGNFTTSEFVLASDGNGGTDITLAAPGRYEAFAGAAGVAAAVGLQSEFSSSAIAQSNDFWVVRG